MIDQARRGNPWKLRDEHLWAAGAVAAAAAAPRPAKPATVPRSKLYVAACTPCDKNLKFDEGVYKDMMAWFKEKGADGVVVLGTTGEYPSFSVAERKKVAETALKHRSGLLIIVQVGTPNFPETIELVIHAAANGADGVLLHPAVLLQEACAGRADEVLLADFGTVQDSGEPLSHSGDQRRADHPRAAARAGDTIRTWPASRTPAATPRGTRASSRSFPS